jgi:hypothetical protein
MNELINLIKTGRLKIQYTKINRYPLITIDGRSICQTELKKYGFNNFEEFIKWSNAYYG